MKIIATLCFLVRGNEILLGLKKRRIGAGKRNGIGGRKEADESIEDCALRELWEESRVRAEKQNLQQVARVNFSNGTQLIEVHVFLVPAWEGDPQSCGEMEMVDYRWYRKDHLPLAEMMPADKHWLPLVLAGQKIAADVRYNSDQSQLLSFKWQPLSAN